MRICVVVKVKGAAVIVMVIANRLVDAAVVVIMKGSAVMVITNKLVDAAVAVIVKATAVIVMPIANRILEKPLDTTEDFVLVSSRMSLSIESFMFVED